MNPVFPARYFVVDSSPLRMRPGLFRLGHDFGNGPLDAQVFQADDQAPAYLAEKKRVLDGFPRRLQRLEDGRAEGLQAAAAAWIAERIGGRAVQEVGSLSQVWQSLTLRLQEDLVLLQRRPDGGDRLVLLSVCFPSGWRPEGLLGAGFDEVHAPVPEFDSVSGKRRQLVDAMVKRGPYVRFVWTVTADSRLDHHPDHSPRREWREDSPGFLRVERQVTVPFPEQDGSLFVIRTYLYAFDELDRAERLTLRQAIESMPNALAEYKGVDALARGMVIAKLG